MAKEIYELLEQLIDKLNNTFHVIIMEKIIL